jgi:membrane associated rhomboid family serine protease
MFLPFGKDNPVRTFPLVTACLIAVNVIVFIAMYGDPLLFDEFTFRFGLTPGQPTAITAFSYLFLHADPGHLGFNMLFLWVFGPNVEDLMGRPFYLVFYLACGLAAAFLHLASVSGGANQIGLLVGASGAISGLMGAYFVLFPLSRIMVFPFFISIHAFWFILIWIYMQLRSQVLFADESNVAFMAHLGGFAFGAGFVFLLMRTGIVVVPNFEQVRRGRYADLGPGDELDELLREAARTGDVSRAVAAFGALMRTAPGTRLGPDALLAAAAACVRAGDPALAVAAYRKAMTNHPDTTQALHAGLAIAQISLNIYRDTAAAQGYLNWVIAAAPASPDADQARALLRAISGY